MSLRAEISTQHAFVLLTAEDVAGQLSCSPRHVRRLSDRGAMPAPVKVGRLVRWDRDSIERWVASGCPALARHRT
ncbi:MAG: helix-turn-helix domain-containing protein [Phycisphaeraceae bacterium]|nr:helix-turn-helix domain-containing protein [Phycisphaeraceae bacterium]